MPGYTCKIVIEDTHPPVWRRVIIPDQITFFEFDNGNTYSTLYAHMNSAPVVSVGQNVSKGQVLGYVGSTGNSTGNHLHLEMKVNNVLVNVMNYLS